MFIEPQWKVETCRKMSRMILADDVWKTAIVSHWVENKEEIQEERLLLLYTTFTLHDKTGCK